MNNDNRLNFEGQFFYIGMDVHLKSWTVTIRSEGIALKRMNVPPSPEQLLEYMTKNYPGGIYYSAYEAGYCGFWIYRRLNDIGISCIVVNAADIPTTEKEKQFKTDIRDSRKIARELEKGELDPIYVPSEENESIRSLCRLRERHVAQTTAAKLRIKSVLARTLIDIPIPAYSGRWSNRLIARIKYHLKDIDSATADYLMDCIGSLEEHQNRSTTIMLEVKEYIKEHNPEILRLLLSVPGIGIKTAIVLITEIEDMKRFGNFDRLCSFAGLAPGSRSSGAKEVTTGLTKRCSKRIKHVIIESAWIAMRRDPALFAA